MWNDTKISLKIFNIYLFINLFIYRYAILHNKKKKKKKKIFFLNCGCKKKKKKKEVSIVYYLINAETVKKNQNYEKIFYYIYSRYFLWSLD